jgi:hypothetical protein
MQRSKRVVSWIVLLMLVLASVPADTFAASALRLGRPISAYSASLFGKTNLTARQQQTLACDPDEPLFGSTSVEYDVGVVRVTGFGYAEGYQQPQESQFLSGAGIEVMTEGFAEMRDLATYLQSGPNPNVVETGYLQLFWERSASGTPGHYLPPDEQLLGFNSAFTDGVDTHFFTFEYLPGIPDEIPAAYRVFDALQRGSGNQVDFMASGDPGNPQFTQPGEIVDAVIAGTAVPEPSMSIIALLAMGASRIRGRKASARDVIVERH